MTHMDTLDLRALVTMVRRQLRLLLLSVAIVLALALLYLFNATPSYTASALIYVDPSEKDLLTTDPFQSLSGASEALKVESEVEILRSDRVLYDVMQRLDLMQDAEFGPRLSRLDQIKVLLGLGDKIGHDPQAGVASTYEKLSEAVSIRRRGQTFVIAVSVQSESPERAARIANEIAQAYIDQQIASKSAVVLASRDLLQGQIDTARTRLAEGEARFTSFITDNLSRLSVEVGTERFKALQREFKELRQGAQVGDAQVSRARAALEGNNWEEVISSLSDDGLSALNAQRQTLERRRQGVAQGSGEDLNLRAGLIEIETRFQQRAEAALRSLETAVSEKRDALDELQEDLRSEVLKSELSPETLADIFELQQEADIAQRQYSNLLSRLRDLEAQALVQVADSRIVSQALPPNRPSAPNGKLILILALLVGLAAGVSLAVVNEFFIGGVTALSQLRNLVTGPVIGAIPSVSLSDAQITVADLVIDEPMSFFSEAIRRLRANVDIGLRGKGLNSTVIMVSSANSKEGKSSASLALARTYAEAGKSVLLIDADLRSPAQHKQIGYEPDAGFMEYLRNPTQELDLARGFYVADPKSRTGIILGRSRADVPTDQLLQSAAFSELLESARQSMDVVIIDTPPVLPVVDARYIAPLVDAIVLIVKYGSTSQGDVRDTFTQLDDVKEEGTPILTVLNFDETKLRKSSYYSYYS
ncbi:GumC family protein [Celeribacter sp. ULVN23_4]